MKNDYKLISEALKDVFFKSKTTGNDHKKGTFTPNDDQDITLEYDDADQLSDDIKSKIKAIGGKISKDEIVIKAKFSDKLNKILS